MLLHTLSNVQALQAASFASCKRCRVAWTMHSTVASTCMLQDIELMRLAVSRAGICTDHGRLRQTAGQAEGWTLVLWQALT